MAIDPRIGEIASEVEQEWRMCGLTDNLYGDFAAEVATRYAAERVSATTASRVSEEEVERMEAELYDVAFALNPRMPPLEALPRTIRQWLRERAQRLVREDGWTLIPPEDDGAPRSSWLQETPDEGTK